MTSLTGNVIPFTISSGSRLAGETVPVSFTNLDAYLVAQGLGVNTYVVSTGGEPNTYPTVKKAVDALNAAGATTGRVILAGDITEAVNPQDISFTNPGSFTIEGGRWDMFGNFLRLDSSSPQRLILAGVSVTNTAKNSVAFFGNHVQSQIIVSNCRWEGGVAGYNSLGVVFVGCDLEGSFSAANTSSVQYAFQIRNSTGGRVSLNSDTDFRLVSWHTPGYSTAPTITIGANLTVQKTNQPSIISGCFVGSPATQPAVVVNAAQTTPEALHVVGSTFYAPAATEVIALAGAATWSNAKFHHCVFRGTVDPTLTFTAGNTTNYVY